MKSRFERHFSIIWAEVSEKYSDAIPDLKYGGGLEAIRNRLESISVAADAIESVEKRLADGVLDRRVITEKELAFNRAVLTESLRKMLEERERYRLH